MEGSPKYSTYVTMKLHSYVAIYDLSCIVYRQDINNFKQYLD